LIFGLSAMFERWARKPGWRKRQTGRRLVHPANGQVSAAADPIRSRRGHERSECLGAFHSSAVCCKRC